MARLSEFLPGLDLVLGVMLWLSMITHRRGSSQGVLPNDMILVAEYFHYYHIRSFIPLIDVQRPTFNGQSRETRWLEGNVVSESG